MHRAPISGGPTPRHPGPPASAGLDAEALGRTFRIGDLAERLAAVDARIADCLRGDGGLLGPAAARVAGGGGKRLRPLFTIVGAALGGVFDDRVVAAAAAAELVQVGSLVHDDILDRAATRRGRPTINALEGVDHALLAGDYVLARAGELAASVSADAARLVAETLSELCEGQMLELRDAFDPDRTLDAHFRSIEGKTAALFAGACRLGALCGGLDERDAEALERFGHAFGMAFQLLDDVLDLVGDPARLGKPTGSDIASGVYTMPVLVALAGPSGGELRRLLAPLAAEAAAPRREWEDDQPVPDRRRLVERALHLVLASGSVTAALQEMDRYADIARRAVGHLDQTPTGEGLAAFPRTYTTWALENLMDTRFLEVSLTALR